MPRTALTPGALYKMLSDELRARREYACQCRMPLPYIVATRAEGTANWHVGTPWHCDNGCDTLIASIVEKARADFDVRDPTALPVPQFRTDPAATRTE